MRKLIGLFALLALLGAQTVFAQGREVTGTVVDRGDRQPMPGVSVVVKGSPATGVATDINGRFAIKVSDSDILVFSFVGMKTQEVSVAGKNHIEVDMESTTEALDEVMVVAYGTAKKSSFTGSASVVKSEELGKVQTTNVVTALNGRVSGVQMTSASGQPGQASPTIRIRGISSINAGNSPLYILDGTPYDGDVNLINSQDIESMTVLKDAASNALYGARGANGVIMITTKKGRSTGGTQVTADAKWGANTRATQDYEFINDPAHYYETYYKALYNYAIDAKMDDAWQWANKNLTASNDYGLSYNIYSVPQGSYLIGQNGKLNPNAKMGNVVTYKGNQYTLTADDWLDEAYKSSLRQEYNLTISGATGKGSFYSSVNYLKNEGITKNSGFERFTARLKAEHQAKEWLKVTGNISFSNYSGKSMSEDGSSNSSGNVFSMATQMAPIYPLFIRDGEGNIMKDEYGNVRYDYGDKENAGLTRPTYPGANALSDAILNTNSYNGNAANVTGVAEVKFYKDLKFTSTNTANLDETRTNNVTNPFFGSYSSSNGMLYKYHTRSYRYSFQQLLNYSHSFGLHNAELMVGHESYRSKYYYLMGHKTNMFDPNNTELAGAITEGSSNSYTTDYNTEGWFGRLQYNYNERYFLSASFRRDASSRFHKDNRWGNFWSAGAAWLLSKENWFHASWVDMLKVKFSYGEQGNDAIGNYQYTDVYDIVNGVGHPASVPSSKGNKDISWEKNGNLNAGIDFELFGNRLSGTVEYFYRKTSDMLAWFTLPISYGYTGYYANIGDMTNKGIEVELKGDVLRTNDLLWSVNLNLTHYKNEITYLPEERKTMEVDGVRGYSSGNKFYGEGESLYTYHIKRYAGVNPETGEAMYYKGKRGEEEKTVLYNEADYYLTKTSLPDVYGGFGTSLSWKGFDFAIDFAYSIGGKVYDGDYASSMNVPTATSKGHVMHGDLRKAWTPENPDSNIPRLQYNDLYTISSSDRFLTDASYLSLQNINFGYTLPANLTRKVGIERVRAYLACDNVWLWSKRQGLDPRQSLSGSSTASYYAPIRTISGGVTFTF